uniref:Uncharacterized protein n=1 Tax=Panagrolaimus davidi TaxID=227884 RepID=A0A914RD29_9BILA
MKYNFENSVDIFDESPADEVFNNVRVDQTLPATSGGNSPSVQILPSEKLSAVDRRDGLVQDSQNQMPPSGSGTS